MTKIVKITDPFGGEHILVYKSETEWTSYTKTAYDEMLAAQVEHLTESLPASKTLIEQTQ